MKVAVSLKIILGRGWVVLFFGPNRRVLLGPRLEESLGSPVVSELKWYFPI
jgi:hypothetical protein